MSTNTSRSLLALVAGIFSGAVGFYAGLFLLLAATGLDSPSWAPVAQVTGAAFFAAVAISLVMGLSGARAIGVTTSATIAGVAAGGVIMLLDLDFEAAIIAGLLVVATTAAIAPRVGNVAVSPQTDERTLVR